MALWLPTLFACSGSPVPPATPPDPPPTLPAPTAHTGQLVACVDVDLGDVVPAMHASRGGSRADRMDGTCAPPDRPDRVFRFTATTDRDHRIVVEPEGFDAVLWVAPDCGEPQLACIDIPGLDPEVLVLGLGIDESVIIGVEAFDGPLGDFELWVEAVAFETCDNEVDDDADGRVDCLDPECFTAPICAHTCPDLVFPMAEEASVVGDTVGERDGWDLGCLPFSGTSDVSVSYRAPAAASYVFDLVGSDFDTVLTVFDGCAGDAIACNDDGPGHAAPTSQVVVELDAGQTVVAVVDGPDLAHVGAFALNVAPLQDAESDCADGRDLDADGDVDCADSDCALDAACPEVCDDALDNDGDGALDCVDLACALDPACPEVCDNQADDDADGSLDCLDARCASDPVCDAACPEHVLIPGETWLGSTLGRPDRELPSCTANSSASDVTLTYTATADGIVTFDTEGSGYDTVLTVLDGCGGAVLACNDDAGVGVLHSQAAVNLSSGQSVTVVIDGFGSASGAVVLNASPD